MPETFNDFASSNVRELKYEPSGSTLQIELRSTLLSEPLIKVIFQRRTGYMITLILSKPSFNQ